MITKSSSIRVTAPEKKIAFAALHHRDYRRYFIVNLFSAMGDNIEHVISYWLLYQKFHSPVLAGFALSATGRRSCSSPFISARLPTGTIVAE